MVLALWGGRRQLLAAGVRRCIAECWGDSWSVLSHSLFHLTRTCPERWQVAATQGLLLGEGTVAQPSVSLADLVMKVCNYLCQVDLIETFSAFQTQEFSKSENKTHCL